MRRVVSPRAATRLAAAAEFLAGIPADGEVLIVGATRGAVDDLVRQVAQRRGATLGLHRFTLTQLAARLAAPALSTAGCTPCTGLAARALAARATSAALAAGSIPFYAAVARMPGFIRSLAATLEELRGAAVDVGSLAAAAPPADQLARLLDGYEAALRDARLADRAALFAAASAAVRASGDPLIGAPLLLLDVVAESRVEADLLAALQAASAHGLLTLAPGDAAPVAAAVAAPDANSLCRLQAFLFAPTDPPPAPADDSVRLFSAPGEGREAVEIARAVLAEARAGVRFDRMAVFLRSPETYTALLEAAFRRAGVPAYFTRGVRRPHPSGRAFLALLACAADGLSAARFAEYASLGQVPAAPADAGWVGPRDETLGVAAAAPEPGSPASPDSAEPSPPALAAPWRWEALLTDAAVIGGVERWRRRLAGLAHELALRAVEQARDEPDAPRLAALQRTRDELAQLQRIALPLIERLAALPEAAPWSVWLAALDELALAALRDANPVRELLAELAPMGAVGPVHLDEVCDVLGERLTTLHAPPIGERYGRVLVASVDEARGRSAAVVFVPCLAERLFPQRPREDPLLLDGLRGSVSDALATQEQRVERERRRLELAVGAAEQRLHLSYPRADVIQGRPRVTSFYGLDVARAALGAIPDVEKFERDATSRGNARLAWPAPPDPATAIDTAEHDLATLAALIHQPAGERPKGAMQYLVELNAHLGRSLRARYARWELRSWQEVDGLTRPSPAAAEQLQQLGLTQRAYSPSALQHYAACPYRFFLAAVQRLAPREERAALDQLDPLTRGRLVHQVQAETLRGLEAAGALPLGDATLACAESVLLTTLARVAAQAADDLAPPIARVWDDAVASLRTDLLTWLRQLAAAGGNWRPAYVEYAFGLTVGAAHDPASRSDEAIIAPGYRLRGAVDLIERRADGALRVVDHKTGLDRTRPGLVVGQGETLQPVLYGLAVEAALGAPVADARLSYCTARGGFSERVVTLDARARRSGADVLRLIDSAITAGRFPPAPREKACEHCDFRMVCGPYEERRAANKPSLPELDLLRGTP
ncbi:MAG: PD-(D/E)XK nuclease family protein [Deltaproteobacteria bacterium]|nr:PD-(D/E)XK nuclease family protein [Deltaproteobacteria bacterium]